MKTDCQCGPNFKESGWAGEKEIHGLLLHDCVPFGSDNISGCRPIDQQLVWHVAPGRNVCLFSKWSSST